ncbi:MAG: diphosphate--fructose-6-phosphate 1-phosphotransferase [Gemmataceae bacterium]|jgi:6-phosphofructokinase 1|uniref:Pyrophosphate--fructose 6-phosphate 1-phosphotransferase n=1 Tax=Thermogemmata fonticola TaxID=2755323 RepID=A0A7V8VFY3_9BACT|nr:diphosphate--fructose-6-phosphate 1-phosphotransferase [Thermogemmata fonticola]MBA2227251.1 6-phosphofructokinase [Thermogemmata fonticola]MCX8138755.1 diphosphate--fructose-6-phosphate 1-phosphotransferase [Gemmataceae bacterium]
MAERGKLGIVVGGGPAPGINGVISSVTIEAINQGLEVIGIRDGFKHLVNGDLTQVRTLTIPDVAPFYQKGGSLLGTSRTNPTKDPQHMANVLEGLRRLGIQYLVTIGGDDTAFSGSQVYQHARGEIRVAHVPKTIDNDLPLPPGIPTFGFETARHYGAQLARNLHEDAKTTNRWYIVVSMGRAAGHLALGIGKASAATVTIIAEEFQNRTVTLELICDIIIGSMIKRKAQGKGYGLAVLAEGLMESIGEERLKEILSQNPGKFGNIEVDAFGHLRLGEIEFGRLVRTFLADRLKALGLKFDMIDKDLGYELRCADPIPFDAEYTRNLGYGAVKFLLSPQAERHGVVITFVGGSMVPRPFEEMIDPATRKMRPRLVDIHSETYEVARRYMIRLEKSDFDDPARLEKLAAVVKMTPSQFTERFGYLVH